MYKLIDGVKRNRENPSTFEIPSEQDKASLSTGNYAKLVFEEGEHGERMWVKITDINGDSFVGELNNDPSILATIEHGDKVEFNSKHIIGILQ